MAAPVKALDNQSKHLTGAEISARQQAEAETIPDRQANLSKPPKGVTGAAGKYWRTIVARMDGVRLCDDLDRDVLGIYCQQLARRDKLQKLLEAALAECGKAETSAAQLEVFGRLEALTGKVDKLEKSILAYADRLGLTPQSRVRLAKSRADAVQEDAEEKSMFG